MPRVLRLAPAALIVVVLAFQSAVSVRYAVRLPRHAGPDEADHLRYVAVLADCGRLPRLPGFTDDARVVAVQAQHPPLYYALLAGARCALRAVGLGGERALRFVSLPLIAATLLVVWVTARRLWPQDPWRPAVAVSFVALLPQTQYMGSVVNNSVGALAAAALVVSLCHRVLAASEPRRRDWLLLGTAVAAALCTKLTVLWLLPLVGAALAAQVGRPVPPARKLERLGLLMLPVALLFLPWVVRNQLCYDTPLPERVTDRRLFPDGLATALAMPGRVAEWVTIGTQDGLMGFGSPFWLFTPRVSITGVSVVSGALLLAPLPGLGLLGRRVSRPGALPPGWRARRTFWAALGVSLTAFWLLVLAMATHDRDVVLFGGRYLWEAAGAVGLLWTLGLFGLPAGPVRTVILAAALAGLAGLSLVVQAWVLAA